MQRNRQMPPIALIPPKKNRLHGGARTTRRSPNIHTLESQILDYFMLQRRDGRQVTAKLFAIAWLTAIASHAAADTNEAATNAHRCTPPEANYIAIARVEEEELRTTPDDPEGISGWLYRVQSVMPLAKSTQPARATVFSENTTARVPLEVGRTYLLFASLHSRVGVLEVHDSTFEMDEEMLERAKQGRMDACLLEALGFVGEPD
jgi:hypothetical protein